MRNAEFFAYSPTGMRFFDGKLKLDIFQFVGESGALSEAPVGQGTADCYETGLDNPQKGP